MVVLLVCVIDCWFGGLWPTALGPGHRVRQDQVPDPGQLLHKHLRLPHVQVEGRYSTSAG